MKKNLVILIFGVIFVLPNCASLKTSNVLNNEGFALLQKGKYNEAHTKFEEALKRDSDHPFALNNLGVIYEKRGQYLDALRLYQQAARTGSSRNAVVEVDDPSLKGLTISELAKENADRLKTMIPEQR